LKKRPYSAQVSLAHLLLFFIDDRIASICPFFCPKGQGRIGKIEKSDNMIIPLPKKNIKESSVEKKSHRYNLHAFGLDKQGYYRRKFPIRVSIRF